LYEIGFLILKPSPSTSSSIQESLPREPESIDDSSDEAENRNRDKDEDGKKTKLTRK
jgi:hypothetical protein